MGCLGRTPDHSTQSSLANHRIALRRGMSSQERRQPGGQGSGPDRRERARCLIEQYRSVVGIAGRASSRHLSLRRGRVDTVCTSKTRSQADRSGGISGARELARKLSHARAPPPQPPQTGFEEEAQGAGKRNQQLFHRHFLLLMILPYRREAAQVRSLILSSPLHPADWVVLAAPRKLTESREESRGMRREATKGR